LAPFSGDRILAEEKRCQLDRWHQRICDNLDALLREVGLKSPPDSIQREKTLVGAPIR
jgi:hypothetical protein